MENSIDYNKMKRYKQKLREVWLQMPEFRQWLRRDPEDSYRAHCRFCKCGVNTKLSDLRAHALTKKHMKRNQTVEVRHMDSDNEDDEDQDYKPKVKHQRRDRTSLNDKYIVKQPLVIKNESRTSNGPDYETIIESLALYEPEQALFSNESTTQYEHQIDNTALATNIDEEMITNAVSVAVRNLKDSSQIFGDFVADRLRQLTEDTSEFVKDKIMQVILEATALNRTNKCN